MKQILRPSLPPNLTVKIVGLGGVGGPVARYLSVFLAAQPSATRLVLIDGDAFEPSNASRMIFGGYGNKAEVVREELLDRVADSLLTVEAVEAYLAPSNLGRLIQDGDWVLLCVDNHATRKLVNDHCSQSLANVCLISGGNDGVTEPGSDGDGPVRRGTYGTVQVYQRVAGRDASPSLARHHPEINQASGKLPSELSCTELVVGVPQILFTNLATASAMLNALWLCLCQTIPYHEVVFDIADGLMRPVKYPMPNLR